MRIINTVTGETVAEIMTNHSMCLDEAIDCAGGEIINDMADDRWSDDGDNVIIDGIRYWYDDLDTVWED